MTPRPRITCLMTASLDGRLQPSRYTNRPDGTPGDWDRDYGAAHAAESADAWLIGRVAMAEMAKGTPHPPADFAAPPRPIPPLIALEKQRRLGDVARMSQSLPPSQAEAMIRRVSPEGRARAQREQARRQRAATQAALRMALALGVVVLVAVLIDRLVMPIGALGVLVALAVAIAACVGIALAGRDRAVPLEHAPIATLPGETERWLEAQRPYLPSASGALLDSITLRLADMTPHLNRLDPAEPGAAAVRRLLATDLPALVGGYQEVPARLRAQAGSGGRSADAHLFEGLGVIDGEIGRMTEQLARGAFDELATQHRFLELKYEPTATL